MGKNENTWGKEETMFQTGKGECNLHRTTWDWTRKSVDLNCKNAKVSSTIEFLNQPTNISDVASQNLDVDIPRRPWMSTSLFCCGLLTGWLMCRVMEQNSTLWQAYKTLWNIFLKITVFLMHGSLIFSNNVV